MYTLLIIAIILSIAYSKHVFEAKGEQFLKDGEPFTIMSGSMHYFRHHPDYWEDRIAKLKAMGLNTISTYVAWNLHEPERGQYNWTGLADIERFLKLTQKYEMFVLLRPGPYICGEWEFGGIPYWVMETDGIKIRTSDKLWESEITKWYSVFMPLMKPYLFSEGGNIIFVQVENEYGFYGCDHEYIEWLYNETIKYTGTDIIIYTTDTFNYNTIKCGTYEKAYAAVDFGVRDAKSAFDVQRQVQKVGPPMNSEFYPGWLSHWGEKYPHVDTSGVVNTMVQMLDLGASFNFYMAIGGTNFGFYNGANGDGNSMQVDTTSYDYDAPLSEAGDCTYKCMAIRNKLQSYHTDVLPDMPKNTTKKGYGDIIFTKSAYLFENLDKQVQGTFVDENPLNFEKVKLAYGFVLYSTEIKDSSSDKKLKMLYIRDVAIIYVNNVFIARVERWDDGKEVNIGSNVGTLYILVENYGRINFGSGMTNLKGIFEVTLNGKKLQTWKMQTLPMNDVVNLNYQDKLFTAGPAWYYGILNVDEPADTWIDVRGWVKGHIYVNGFNIGRYWEPGPPQHALHVPGPLLKKGKNEIVVFEQTHPNDSNKMTSIDHPILDY